MSDLANGFKKDLGGPITLREIILVIGLTASGAAYYFSGQAATTERVNKLEATMSERTNRLEGDMNQRIQLGNGVLADRVGKLETREAVIEQHQTQSDASIAETRTSLASFAVEVRGQLGKISDQIAELRPLIAGREGAGKR